MLGIHAHLISTLLPLCFYFQLYDTVFLNTGPYGTSPHKAHSEITKKQGLDFLFALCGHVEWMTRANEQPHGRNWKL